MMSDPGHQKLTILWLRALMVVVGLDLYVAIGFNPPAMSGADEKLAVCGECFSSEPRQLFAAVAVREAVGAQIIIDFVVVDLALINASVALDQASRSRCLVVTGFERRATGRQLPARNERCDHLFIVQYFVGRVPQHRTTPRDRLGVR
ncbi:hypothetical protein WS80_29155 [Burkholderia pseudomultivorans]|nr:hypothetical protein WS80_29155 [Burkholderia pseudomultivorans]